MNDPAADAPIRRGHSTATGGRGIFSPLFIAVAAALGGFGMWVWLTGPGTSVPVALVGFAIAVACGRMAFSAMAKPAADDDEVPTKLDGVEPDAIPPDPATRDPDAGAEEPRGADAPAVPDGAPPTLDGVVVDPPPAPPPPETGR